MIGRRHLEDIRALQENAAGHAAQLGAVVPQVELLVAQVATLSSHVATVAAQMSAELDRAAGAAAKISELEGFLMEADCRASAHAAALSSQATETDRLREQADQQAETIRQLQGALARLDRQAKIDMDEMRQTNAAIAQTVLLTPRSHRDMITDGGPAS